MTFEELLKWALALLLLIFAISIFGPMIRDAGKPILNMTPNETSDITELDKTSAISFFQDFINNIRNCNDNSYPFNIPCPCLVLKPTRLNHFRILLTKEKHSTNFYLLPPDYDIINFNSEDEEIIRKFTLESINYGVQLGRQQRIKVDGKTLTLYPPVIQKYALIKQDADGKFELLMGDELTSLETKVTGAEQLNIVHLFYQDEQGEWHFGVANDFTSTINKNKVICNGFRDFYYYNFLGFVSTLESVASNEEAVFQPTTVDLHFDKMPYLNLSNTPEGLIVEAIHFPGGEMCDEVGLIKNKFSKTIPNQKVTLIVPDEIDCTSAQILTRYKIFPYVCLPDQDNCELCVLNNKYKEAGSDVEQHIDNYHVYINGEFLWVKISNPPSEFLTQIGYDTDRGIIAVGTMFVDDSAYDDEEKLIIMKPLKQYEIGD